MKNYPSVSTDTSSLHVSFTNRELWEELVDIYDGKIVDPIKAISLKQELQNRGVIQADFTELNIRLGVRNCFVIALLGGSRESLLEHSLRAFNHGATAQFLLDTIYKYRKDAYESIKGALEKSEKTID